MRKPFEDYFKDQPADGFLWQRFDDSKYPGDLVTFQHEGKKLTAHIFNGEWVTRCPICHELRHNDITLDFSGNRFYGKQCRHRGTIDEIFSYLPDPNQAVLQIKEPEKLKLGLRDRISDWLDGLVINI